MTKKAMIESKMNEIAKKNGFEIVNSFWAKQSYYVSTSNTGNAHCVATLKKGILL